MGEIHNLVFFISTSLLIFYLITLPETGSNVVPSGEFLQKSQSLAGSFDFYQLDFFVFFSRFKIYG